MVNPSDISFWANEPEYSGWFTRQQAEGAIPNGRRVVKSYGEPGDANPVGAGAVVLGSMRAPHYDGVFYFVEWDNYPKTACGVLDRKIKEA